MSDGLMLVGTDRGVGKTLVGVGLVAILRERGVDATMLTPISTGGASESAISLLRQVGVDDDRKLLNPVSFETPTSPYVASLVEKRPVVVDLIRAAYATLRSNGKFVIVEGSGVLVPMTRKYAMIDLVKELDLPSIIVGRTSRGTLNHCLLTMRMMVASGVTPRGFILNGFGQFGDGFAESLNPEALQHLAEPVPVLATLEWRPEFRDDVHRFVDSLRQQERLVSFLKDVVSDVARPASPEVGQ